MARELTRNVYGLTRKADFARDFGLKGQIQDAAGSSMHNIAEGFERGGNKEFIQFLYIAKGSCGETRSQAYRAHDRKYIDQKEFDELLKRTETESIKIAKLIKHLKNSDLKGAKFH